MASFKALNVESEDEIDEEPDNTRELQIEDALKIYQTAVKLQSQGAAYLKETEQAYKSLFESEVFKYPESLSEYNRIENYGNPLGSNGQILTEQDTPTYTTSGNPENAPSTLPQVLHLSYKNRGQLHLDALRAARSNKQEPDELEAETTSRAVNALNDFAEALDKDADDVDVWRRAARAGQLLGSHSLSRFCLEAIVDGDEQGTDDVLGDAGIDIKLADHDLRRVKDELGDVVSTGPVVARSADLTESWRGNLRLYKELPNLKPSHAKEDSERIVVVAEPSWAAVGNAILRQVPSERPGSSPLEPGTAWTISISNDTDDDLDCVLPAIRLNNGVHPRTSLDNATSADVSTVPVHREAASRIDDLAEESAIVNEKIGMPQSPVTMTLPTRKRTSEAAELPENADGPRGRSKRIRARESLVGDGRDGEPKPAAESLEIEQRIKHTAQGDEWLLDILRPMTAKAGICGHPSSIPYRKLVRREVTDSPEKLGPDLALAQAVKDFYNAMQTWNDSKTKAILGTGQSPDTSAGTGQSTLLNFLERSNVPRRRLPHVGYQEGLAKFVSKINHGWFSTSEVAMEWVRDLCQSSYTGVAWTSNLKQVVIQLIIELDELFYASTREMQSSVEEARVGVSQSPISTYVESNFEALNIAQSIFEIHLEVLAEMASSSGEVTADSRCNQLSRSAKWSNLARDAMSFHFQQPSYDANDPREVFMRTRHLWASVFQMRIHGDESQEHVVALLSHLKHELEDAGHPVFELPNSNIFPELSATAMEREISDLQTMDFFHSIFRKEGQAPADLIERLEPLLEQTVEPPQDADENSLSVEVETVDSPTTTNGVDKDPDQVLSQRSPSTLGVLTEFIHKASPSLRLLLWTRLRDAYEAIDYPPKVFSIQLRCIQVLVETLKGEPYTSRSEEERGSVLLDAIRDLRETLESIWKLVTKNDAGIFECIDIDHLRSSMQTVLDLWMLLYSVSLFDDYSQLGGKGGPTINPFRAYPSDTFHNASIKLHNMQVQTAILLYKLFCEAMVQLPEAFKKPAEDRLQLLRYIHYHFGIRKICKAYEGAFLHFMKDELMTNLSEVEQQSSNDLAQVLYDLYDLHCFSGPLERQDHGCDSDHLDHQTAMQLVDFVLEKASRTSVKDLLKSDLGKAVEKLHSTLNWVVRSNPAALRNRKFYTALLRSPIFPVDLYRAFQGITDTSAIPVHPGDAIVASKGWFFLKGQIALGRYQAQRAKGTRGSEDDLHQANSFFQQDLEFSPERWETWYRMAQTQEGLVENDIMWSSEHINNDLTRLINLQRTAIHAYMMAVSVATRLADTSDETKQKISELYSDFAMCLYAASRKPFSMKAFSFDDFPQKFFSPPSSELYTSLLREPLTEVQAWQFAAVVLTKCTKLNPQNWTVHYMLGKCLWKLHTNPRSDKRESSRKKVQRSFMRALRALPERKDQNRQEPIFEPIYKIVSTTFKLVQWGEIGAADGAAAIEDCLQAQKQIDASKRPGYTTATSWDSYIVDVLKMLRNADKSRWHHRFVLRAAKIMQRQVQDAEEGAMAAKQYLIDQHIYSPKTLSTTLWKPEHERPGRRWVFAKDYALYIGKLLEETHDLEGMQLLAKRVRKKPTEYFEHVGLWTSVVDMHVRLHRLHARVENGCSESIFKAVDQEEFHSLTPMIDQWIADPQDQSPLYVVLREAGELKKINAGLIKPTAIDDLLGDTYAEIWALARPKLQPAPLLAPSVEPKAERMASPSADRPPSPPRERWGVMSLHNVINNVDGSSERGTPGPHVSINGDSNELASSGSHAEPLTAAPIRQRPRLISRREIVKRATDAVALRPSNKAATPPRQVASPLDSSHVQVVINIPSRRGSFAPTGLEPPTAESTPPGSVNDDADDESELSEVDEEEETNEEETNDEETIEEETNEEEVIEVKPIFPGLLWRAGTGSNPGINSPQENSGRKPDDEMVID